jgi:hypothetical protein
MNKAEKFKEIVQSIMINKYDQEQYKHIVELIYQEIYEDDDGLN